MKNCIKTFHSYLKLFTYAHDATWQGLSKASRFVIRVIYKYNTASAWHRDTTLLESVPWAVANFYRLYSGASNINKVWCLEIQF